jgi:hypothetical protein
MAIKGELKNDLCKMDELQIILSFCKEMTFITCRMTRTVHLSENVTGRAV